MVVWICISVMMALIFNNIFKLYISSGGTSRWGIYLVSHLNYFFIK